MDCYKRIRDFFRLIGSAFAVALFGLLILWVAAYCYYGNATLGIDRLRGNLIIVENIKIDSHAVNQESGSVRFSLNIHNLASHPIYKNSRFIGGVQLYSF